MEYKSVPWAPSYLISDEGRVYRNGRELKQTTNGRGYYRVTLSECGRRFDAYVHRLVCEAFHGTPRPGHDCRHRDGVRAHNQEGNLSWATKIENEADKIIHGTNPAGERHPNKILTESLVMDARERAARGERIKDIASTLGFDRFAIRSAIRGANWGHLPGAIPAPESRRRSAGGRYL